MTIVISEIYDALTSAGAPEDKARKATEAISDHGRRFDKLESTIDLRFITLEKNIDARFGNIDVRFANVDARFARIEGELLLVKWMIGFVLAIQVAIFVKLFIHSRRHSILGKLNEF